MLVTILVVAALVLFLLATIGVPDAPRFRLIAGGLACVTLAWLLTNWPK